MRGGQDDAPGPPARRPDEAPGDVEALAVEIDVDDREVRFELLRARERFGPCRHRGDRDSAKLEQLRDGIEERLGVVDK